MNRQSKLLSIFVAACAFALALALAGCGGQASGSAASASASASAASAEASASAASDANAVAFTMKIDATDADKGMLYDSAGTVQAGGTVYDALLDTGIDLDVSASSGSTYVDGIGGVVASKISPMAGWLFTVNGETPSVGADGVQIADGDEIVWTFYSDYTQAPSMKQ